MKEMQFAGDQRPVAAIDGGWLIAAVVLAFAGLGGMLLITSGSWGGNGGTGLAVAIAGFGAFLVVTGAVLHQALRPLLAAMRLNPAPTLRATAEVIAQTKANGFTFGSATVRFQDGAGQTIEAELVPMTGPVTEGGRVPIRYNAAGGPWVVSDTPNADNAATIFSLFPRGVIAFGVLLMVISPVLAR